MASDRIKISSSSDCLGLVGFVQKRGHIFPSWRRRWLVLHGKVFTYFKDPADAKTHENFKGAHLVTQAELRGGEVVVTTSFGKIFQLRSADASSSDHDLENIFLPFQAAAELPRRPLALCAVRRTAFCCTSSHHDGPLTVVKLRCRMSLPLLTGKE